LTVRSRDRPDFLHLHLLRRPGSRGSDIVPLSGCAAANKLENGSESLLTYRTVGSTIILRGCFALQRCCSLSRRPLRASFLAHGLPAAKTPCQFLSSIPRPDQYVRCYELRWPPRDHETLISGTTPR
jgi:hypothetical protein